MCRAVSFLRVQKSIGVFALLFFSSFGDFRCVSCALIFCKSTHWPSFPFLFSINSLGCFFFSATNTCSIDQLFCNHINTLFHTNDVRVFRLVINLPINISRRFSLLCLSHSVTPFFDHILSLFCFDWCLSFIHCSSLVLIFDVAVSLAFAVVSFASELGVCVSYSSFSISPFGLFNSHLISIFGYELFFLLSLFLCT